MVACQLHGLEEGHIWVNDLEQYTGENAVDWDVISFIGLERGKQHLENECVLSSGLVIPLSPTRRFF